MDIRTAVLNFVRRWHAHLARDFMGGTPAGDKLKFVGHLFQNCISATYFVDLVDFAAYGNYSPYKPRLLSPTR